MIKPMLARDEPKVFNDPNYLWERKYDGARIIAFNNNSKYRLQSRSGRDKTELFPELEIVTRLPAVLDGEIVPVDESLGFNGIQRRVNRTRDISWAQKEYPAKLMVFDIIELDGTSLEICELEKRKLALEKVLVPSENVQIAPYTPDGVSLYDTMLSQGLEGVVGKHKRGHYLQDRREWLKVKTWQSDTFFACGYTAGTGWRETTFGALVLTDKKGRYVGEVGTGFNNADIDTLMVRFEPTGICPFGKEPEPATWVQPFPVRIQYLEYTNDGILRFPSFKGLVH